MTRYYFAARYGRRAELCAYRDYLTALGHVVTSHWLEPSLIPDDGLTIQADDATLARLAAMDMVDLSMAETVLVFTDPPETATSRGGRHVELGLALAWGKNVVVIGPRENVFCYLPQVRQYATWDDWRRQSRAVNTAPPRLTPQTSEVPAR